ncbi:hypothetical protein F7Q91_03050 [Vibrio chagasii]|uniref:Uncharacterized protein n=1 Tax=Vibrio chagasii TaxID=170679 RepID=A0A7V7THY5_9VIBR|nr:DotI/IcmL/TraM family protein [Vibrio chagasii]KAB0482399.1 hypothetical protein F7Q91_03050 [Vibrio chagasii]
MIKDVLKLAKMDWPYWVAITLSIFFLFKIDAFRHDLLGNPERAFVYVNNDGSYTKAYVSQNPRYTDLKVIRFLRRMASSCYSIDYDTAESIQNGIAVNDYGDCVYKHFAPIAAYSLFQVYPTDSLLDAIISSEGRADTVVPYNPIVIQRNKPEDPLLWVVEVPMMVTVQTLSGDETTSFIAYYTVIPDERANNPSSLLIENVVFK